MILIGSCLTAISVMLETAMFVLVEEPKQTVRVLSCHVRLYQTQNLRLCKENSRGRAQQRQLAIHNHMVCGQSFDLVLSVVMTHIA